MKAKDIYQLRDRQRVQDRNEIRIYKHRAIYLSTYANPLQHLVRGTSAFMNLLRNLPFTSQQRNLRRAIESVKLTSPRILCTGKSVVLKQNTDALAVMNTPDGLYFVSVRLIRLLEVRFLPLQRHSPPPGPQAWGSACDFLVGPRSLLPLPYPTHWH